MTYLYDTFYTLWQSLFGTNFNEPSIIQLASVVSVFAFVGFIIRVIGRIPIFKKRRGE